MNKQTLRVVLLVSGGADSMALLHMAASGVLTSASFGFVGENRPLCRSELHVLHVNHGLRGAAADDDEHFVRDVCEDLGIACTCYRADVVRDAELKTFATSNIEAIGREIRYREAYRLAEQLAQELDCDMVQGVRIATAHNLNDRAETFLMNAMRGAGLDGLSSIARSTDLLVRPLLSYTHEELCAYLQGIHCAWREDATNTDVSHLRSYVRHVVCPAMTGWDDGALRHIADSCDVISQENEFLNNLAAQLLAQATIVERRSFCVLNAVMLHEAEEVLVRRAFRQVLCHLCPDVRLTSQHIGAVVNLARAIARCEHALPVALPNQMIARAEYGYLLIATQHVDWQMQEDDCRSAYGGAPICFEVSSLQIPASEVQEIAIPGVGHLCLRELEVPCGLAPDEFARTYMQDKDSNTALLSLTPGERLQIVCPEQGWRMQPFGMGGHSRLVSDLIYDAHIWSPDKGYVRMLRRESGEALWLLGIRADEHGRITSQSEHVFEATFVRDTR